MSKVLFAIVAVCLVQAVYCGTARRETPTTANPFSEIINEAIIMATNTFNAANKAILEFNDVQNNDELLNKTKNNLYTFGESVRSGIANLNEETKPIQGKADELVNAFKAKVNEIVDDLKANNPNLFSGDLTKLQSVSDNALRTVATETQKLRTKLEAIGHELTPKFEANLKQINDAVVKSAQDLKTQAENTINSITKKN